jgi:succinyl-CoA synthetase beta subunit
MKLREYQAKAIFSQYGIAIPRGETAEDPKKAVKIAEKIGFPVVLKPQLGIKGRGKVGGIAFARNSEEAKQESERLFHSEIRGESVKKLLIEQRVDIQDELYLAVTIDYSERSPVLIASSVGGVDIEEIAQKRPESIYRIPVNILTGPQPQDLSVLEASIDDKTIQHLKILYKIFREKDAELVEINPLVITKAGAYCAVDAVLNINDDSVYRHEDLLVYKKDIPAENPITEEAAEANWTYIEMPGNIAILSSGAGLTMAIMDLIHKSGGSPANFLDTAQIDDQGIYDAFKLLSKAKKSQVLLVNIFAGLNRCDKLAEGIKRYLNDFPMNTPLVVRMVGNLEEEGYKILRSIGIEPFPVLEDAVEQAVKLSKKA